jgi:hypothetical protein
MDNEMAAATRQLESVTRAQRIHAQYDALLIFCGYMQSREARDAARRYKLWRRGEKEVRYRVAAACQRGEISARVALLMLNDTMY